LTGHWPDLLQRYFHVGPLARSVRDISLALSVLAGPDGLDPFALPASEAEEPGAPLKTLRVGWCADGPFSPVDQDVRGAVAAAASFLGSLGCQVEQVSLESWEQWPPQSISDAVIAAEAEHFLGPIVAGREEMLAPSTRRRLKAPRPSMAQYLDATAECERFRQDVAHYFAEYDLLICPTVPAAAHPHGSSTLIIDGQTVPGRNAVRATVPFDLSGSPAISLPFGWSANGLPLAVQVVARNFEEATLLHAAAALEAVRASDQRRPPV
jgi:aspartyl-tRNA(Asn)/glutamyl-tRNA(Gln) amidotransferase subunit A